MRTSYFCVLALFGCLLVISTAYALEVGDLAPPLELEELLQAPAGTEVSWESLVGQVVVLEFWDTQCGPCVAAIRHLNDLQEAFEGEDVVFIAITDESRFIVAPQLWRRPISGWIGLDTDRSVFEGYDVEIYPRTVVVDGQGRIAALTWPTLIEAEHLRRILDGEAPELPDSGRLTVAKGGYDIGSDAPVAGVLLRKAAYPDTTTSIGGGGQRSMFNTTAEAMASWAYGMPRTRIESPADVPGESYDLIVSFPRDEERARYETRRMLEEELGITADRHYKRRDVLYLRRGEAGASMLTPGVPRQGGTSSCGNQELSMVNRPVESFAECLESLVELPVIDKTGIDGVFDIEMTYESLTADNAAELVEDATGLELRRKRWWIEVLVLEVEP